MKKYSDVGKFLDDLAIDKREQVELLRTIIKGTHPSLAEHIKWNAPSYVLDGEDRVTFNVQNKENAVKLVLHMGAKRKENRRASPVMADDSGLISWQSDIRGVMTFSSLDEIKNSQTVIANIIARWLALS